MASHVRHTKTLHEVKAERRVRRRRASFILIVALIVVISIFAGMFAFRYMTDNRIANGDSNASTSLTKADENASVTYTLIKLDTGVFSSVPDLYRNLNNERTYVLLRVDTVSNKVSICTLPANMSCTSDDGNERPLHSFESDGGDASLVSCINALMGVQINHFISLDSDGITRLVDGIDGLDITLSSQIDDPYSGNLVLEAGGAKRSGSEILQIFRARQISDYYKLGPELTNASIINAISKMAQLSETDFQNLLSNISKCLYSDMSSTTLTTAINKLQRSDFGNVYKLVIPGSSQTTTETNERVFQVRTSEFSQMLTKFRDGEDHESSGMVALTKSPETVSVEVRNGAGIVGAATKMSEMIKERGYNVEKTGNAEEGYVYSETLIVYMDEEYESCAYDIQAALDCGRVIYGGDYYTSNQKIISIVGADWAPAS